MNSDQLNLIGQTPILESSQIRIIKFVGLLSISVFILLNSGCRQPVANPMSGSRGGGLFGLTTPKIFGGNPTFGSNQGTGLGSVFSNNQPSGSGFGGVGNLAGGLFGRGRNQNGNAFGQGGSNQGFPNGGFNGQSGQGFQNSQQYANQSNQLQNLNQRLGAYDSDNQLLNTEIAGLKQKLELASQYNQTLKQQLADTSTRIQQSELEKQSALQQMASTQMQYEQLNQRYAQQNSSGGAQGQLAGFNRGTGNSGAPTQFAGGATIRANNSLMQRFSNINIPGGQARMDGDVVRIEFPSDRMFVPGTYQIQPAQLPVLQGIASTIRQNFPKQIIGIEAHWDNTPLNPPTTTHHQLTANQSLSVFDNLKRLGLPNEQLFTMAMGSNRPRHAQGVNNGISPNRRIELVIYPETYDGSY